jgi:hypothetical protein
MRYSDSGNGITADSISFFRDHRHQLGPIVTADLKFPGFEDPPDPYLMLLRDDDGNEIRLSGCTTGYPGEGPRGAMLVLLEAGWPVEESRQVFTAATLNLARNETVTQPTPRLPDRSSGPDLAVSGPAGRRDISRSHDLDRS